MTLVRTPVAGPHSGEPPSALHRVGALLWWRFFGAATPLLALAKSAREVGFPALFLPVPFPVTHSVAFSRALRRATTGVPNRIGGRWNDDRVFVGGNLEKVLKDYGVESTTRKTWCRKRSSDDGLVLAQVEKFEPGATPRRPWLTKMVCALEPQSGQLHLAVTSTTPKIDGSNLMAARLRKMYDLELTRSTYPEIGDGVMAALADVGGVKLRPGLWSVPGEAGIGRADSALRYLRGVGSSKVGMMDLYDALDTYGDLEGLVQIALLEEIESLDEILDEAGLKAKGTGALRTAWDRIAETGARIEANRVVLGPAAEALLERLSPLRSRVSEVARRKQVELARRAGNADVRQLQAALETLRQVAREGDRGKLADLRPLLSKARAAALAGGFALLLDRLRKLADAAEHVHQGDLYRALLEAVDFVEKRARDAYPVDYAEPS